MTPEKQACEHCDSPLPSRWDTRGRKARFCSDACRSAAYRARKKREHATELAQARSQMVIDLGALSGTPGGDVTAQMEALASRITHGVGLEPHEEKTLKAAQCLLEVAGKAYWPVSARECVRALEGRIAALEGRLEHATHTARMPVFVRRETPGLHKKAKKKRRR